jgi:hypothetical protein
MTTAAAIAAGYYHTLAIRTPGCSDGLDNDGDGVTDYPDDPGCNDGNDPSEEPSCSDGLDNDGDGLIDYPQDPGCRDATSVREDPQCQDGINNDVGQDPNPGHIDFDGGASLDLDGDGFIDPSFNPAAPAVTDPDPQCIGKPWKNQERKPANTCGLGAELALLLPVLIWVRRRRSSSRSATAAS